MKYMMLICDDPTFPRSQAEGEKLVADYAAFTQEVIDSGEYVAGERLHGAESATSVRVRNGVTATTDGPFAETKEQLGGFYIVEVPHLDRALELAAKIPAAHTGVIEVRPIFPVSE